MKAARSIALLFALILAASSVLPAAATEGNEPPSLAQATPGTTVQPAAAAQTGPPPGLDCAKIADSLRTIPADKRARTALNALRGCRPMPAEIWSAIRDGKWDTAAVPDSERVAMLAAASSHGYAEAESLVVKLLETGAWPDGAELNLLGGARLVRSLSSSLTPYRVHLLLDIYEQKTDEYLRYEVLGTLSHSTLEESFLPAVEAAYDATGGVRNLGTVRIQLQPEKTPEGVLARLIRTLPDGPFLTWAKRIADEHPSDAVKAALKERNL